MKHNASTVTKAIRHRYLPCDASWHQQTLMRYIHQNPLNAGLVRVSIGDRDVRKYLQERYGIADSIKVQELEKEKRNEIIVSCLEIGTGLRQLSRFTGVTYGVINKLNKGR